MMSKYELSSKQVSLVTALLLRNAGEFECEDKDYQSMVRRESRELFNALLTTHNEQEEKGLKTYPSYN